MHPTIYLTFDGRCCEAFAFYAGVLGATVKDVFLNRHARPEDRMEGADDFVLNAALVIGSVTLMGSDAPAAWYQKPQGMSVHLETGSQAEADRVFSAFAEGGTVTMPMGEVFWAERFGMVTDRFGTPWMISFTGRKWGAS